LVIAKKELAFQNEEKDKRAAELQNVQLLLKASEERFRTLVDKAPVGIAIHRNGINLFVNQVYVTMHGYESDSELIGNPVGNLLAPECRGAIVKRIKNREKGEAEPSMYETVGLRKDGSTFPLFVQSTNILLPDGPANVTFLTDISERKQAEEEASSNRRQLTDIIEFLPDATLAVDEARRVIIWNKAIEKMSGIPAAEMIGKGDYAYTIPFYGKAQPPLMDLVFLDDEEIRNRYPLLNREGDSLTAETFCPALYNNRGAWVYAKASALHDQSGKIIGAIESIRDINEQKLAEMGLKSKTAFLEAQTNVSLDGILVVDEKQTRILTNRRFLELFNVPQNVIDDADDTLMLEHFTSLTKEPEQFFKKVLYLYDHVKEVSRDEIELKNGMVLDRYSAPVMDREGKYYGRIWTFHDITEHRVAERKLQEANDKLSNSVKELEERTAEMSLLGEMGEQLQSCQTIEEACAISAQYIQELFPADQGALYLIDPAKDLAEAVNMWGDATSMEKIFMPLDCWAIRRGRPHLVDNSHPGLLCGHTTGSPAGKYLCVPMIANGETIGILHLNHPAPEQDQQTSTDRLNNSEHQTQLALATAENIALALSNLKLRETLRQQSIRDILTGLFNRRYMEESLARELHRAEREKKPVGVIMFDIDHFKEFNDLFGHDGGDALLRELGVFLNNHTRGGDIVSRYGGEEFVVVLPGATLEDTRLWAEELRQGVKELQVYSLGKPLNKCTLSLGVAAFPEHGVASDEILKNADIALYRAKSEGKDRVVVASIIS
jgi:diguanylate cyclase (GGDEF)-like protein/PAS domain S-box-containing protein